MTFLLAEDAALKSLVLGMTVNDEKQQNRPVKVWFGYPDIEIRNQDFPFAVIELIGVNPAYDRMHSGVFTDIDLQGTQTPTVFATVGATTLYKAYTYEVPIPYDLVYQIATYSRHPLHDRAIITQMHRKFPSRRGHLKIANDRGTEYAYRHMFLDSYIKRDTADNESGARRLLTNVYTIRVMSEMTPEVAQASLGRVLSIGLNETPLQYPVPSGKQII